MGENRSTVTETPFSQKGVSLQPGMMNAARGQRSYKSTLERGPSEAALLINLQQLIPGIWTSRGIGWTKERTNAFNLGADFLEFSFFLTNTGVKTPIFQVGDKLLSYDLATQTETNVLTGLSTSAYPTMRRSFSMVTGKSILIYCNGDIEPRKLTDAVTASALQFNGAGWPGAFNGKTYSKPKFCEPFGPAMVFTGFNGLTTAFDLIISDRTDPEVFATSTPVAETDAVAFTYPPELGQITSVRSHRLSNQTTDEVLICGCTDGIFAITGNSASTYSLKILTREIGILSNRCFAQIGDDLLFLSTSGVRSYSSLVANAVLVVDTLSFDIQDYVNMIDKDNAYKAHVFHNLDTQELQFWVPFAEDIAATGQPGHAFILNYSNKINKWSIKQGTNVSCSMVFNKVVYGGGVGGFLQIHYSGDTYNGAAIQFFMRLSLMSLGNPSQKCSIRNIDTVTEGGKQKYSITVYRMTKQADGSFKRTPALPGREILTSLNNVGTALGAWPLGSGAFPSDHLKVQSFQPRGQATFWEVEYGSGASDDALDYCATNYTLSGGSMQR